MLFSRQSSLLWTFAVVFCWSCQMLAVTANVAGQEATASQSAALVVDGRVERVFQADDQFLVQLLVQSSAATQLEATVTARYPAPGELVYIHVLRDRSVVGRAVGRDRNADVPSAQTQIRAFLTSRSSGQWQANGRDWYQENPDDARSVTRNRTPIDQSGQSSLGIVSQLVQQGRDTFPKTVGSEVSRFRWTEFVPAWSEARLASNPH